MPFLSKETCTCLVRIPCTISKDTHKNSYIAIKSQDGLHACEACPSFLRVTVLEVQLSTDHGLSQVLNVTARRTENLIFYCHSCSTPGATKAVPTTSTRITITIRSLGLRTTRYNNATSFSTDRDHSSHLRLFRQPKRFLSPRPKQPIPVPAPRRRTLPQQHPPQSEHRSRLCCQGRQSQSHQTIPPARRRSLYRRYKLYTLRRGLQLQRYSPVLG